MKNAIIGCISNYSKEDIKYWCQSIDDFGFSGDKVMIVYPPISQDLIDYLNEKRFIIIGGAENTNLMDHRFFMINAFLNENNYDYVIHCDVKDAIFQCNPFDWMQENLKKEAIVGSEMVTCKNMPWAVENYQKTFPYEWNLIKDKISFCCGVIGGKYEYLRDFFLILLKYNLTGNKLYEGWWRDQAALNVLLNLSPIDKDFHKSFADDGFVCHLGAKINNDKIIEAEPDYDNDGYVLNSDGEKICIAHQYDRIPELKSLIHKRYVSRTG